MRIIKSVSLRALREELCPLNSFLALMLFWGVMAAPMRAAAPAAIAIAGLEKPADVLIDRWGVPHIYAGTTYDAFVVQGFVAARDRLWQMDLWRKRGLGEMAKDFGAAWVEHDRAARSVLFRGDMYREWLAYGSDAKRVAESFVAGVNAYVALVKAQPERRPLEFKLLGYQPAFWSPEDVVRIRHHGLTLNFTSEIDRAAALSSGATGMRADWLRRELDPPVTPKVAEGVDLGGLPTAELKRAYQLATEIARFDRKNASLAGIPAPLIPASSENAPDADTLASYGSNNWVIAPKLTSTGRPILANDPHRAHGAPSLRYISHLSAPGLDVIGAGEPFLPGISIGHNDSIAFGLTRFYMDQEDLYIYETNPQNEDEYRYRGRWEPMERATETIVVKGEAAPRQVVNRFTRHGPVLVGEASRQRAYALRAAWLDLGMAPYFGSMEYMRAQNWDQFRAALNRWGAPGENQVYADRGGNVGWIPAGLTPIRPNWDGLTPVPGDGRYEWAGFRHGDELPMEFNPSRGYVITANENNIPPDHPAAKKGVGYEWADPARSNRLKQLFEEKISVGGRFAVGDSERMQTDIVAWPARRILKLLAPLQSTDAATAVGLQLLRSWNGEMATGSAAAALYEVWTSGPLRVAVLKAALAGEQSAKAAPGDPSRIRSLLENPEGVMSAQQRDALLLSSLALAVADVTQRLGTNDPSKWQWGSLHRADFRHPLRAVVDEATRQKLDVGEWPIGGSGATPMATSYRPTDFGLTSGASFRMVLDVGNWDASRVVNTPGQSGDPASPHYRDLAPVWARGDYFPLVFSRSAVEQQSNERLRLEPAR
ncbi:MAG: penicillin acylase family protein [Opitutus sp.]|nr:penicillin acylase family protein [Opitutus sp.]